MSLFRPDRFAGRVTQLSPEELAHGGVRALLLDVDNTLAYPGGQTPFEGVPEWLEAVRAAGIFPAIVSNARRSRVEPFASRLRLPFFAVSCKPLPFGLSRARRKLGFRRRETLLVGDQLFTDVLGGRLSGIATVLVTPVAEETGRAFRWKRRMEKKLLRRWEKRRAADARQQSTNP